MTGMDQPQKHRLVVECGRESTRNNDEHHRPQTSRRASRNSWRRRNRFSRNRAESLRVRRMDRRKKHARRAAAPAHDCGVERVLACAPSPRYCLRSARRWHRTFRRMPSAKRPRDDLHFEDEPDRRNRSRQSARRGRERRGQPARNQRRQVERILLRARSVVAGGLHDRRQHRREFRRSAYSRNTE